MHIILVLSMLESEIARLKPAWAESERCSFGGDDVCMCRDVAQWIEQSSRFSPQLHADQVCEQACKLSG